MDSINKQQPEQNHQNLNGHAAVEKIREICEKAKNCFFCTSIKTGEQFTTRPMSVQKIDENGNFWFLSASDSHKNTEIASDSRVRLLFQGSTYSDFISLQGRATINKDKAVIKELWEPLLKTWFTDGIEDTRISVIKVSPEDGYYWDTKHGQLVAFVKQVAGAITGKTLDDSIEGKLTV